MGVSEAIPQFSPPLLAPQEGLKGLGGLGVGGADRTTLRRETAESGGRQEKATEGNGGQRKATRGSGRRRGAAEGDGWGQRD